jgi:hypothetical protein
MPEKIYSHKRNEVQKELEELCKLHDETKTSSGKCREFNSRSAVFLQKLEDMECDRIADMFMDLLIGCSPKEISHCDNHERTKGTLDRIRSRINESVEKRQE